MKRILPLILLFSTPVMADTLKLTDSNSQQVATFISKCIKVGGKLRFDQGWICTPKS